MWCLSIFCRKLSNLGVPQLRALFLEVFGQHTASNNAAWLRRKLSEPPDAQLGRGRSALVRARDIGAAIWTTGNIRNITKVPSANVKNALDCCCWCMVWYLQATDGPKD
jgi:hypothetical protein